jgi:glucose-6-phosphate 1-dehydrogenase
MTANANEVIDSRYLQACDIPIEASKIEPFTLLIFGGTGDLSRKKLMPTLLNLHKNGELPEHFSILGFGRTDMTDAEFRILIKEFLKEYPESVLEEFISHLHYVSGHVGEEATMRRLSARIEIGRAHV